jgi:hypothetical protein
MTYSSRRPGGSAALQLILSMAPVSNIIVIDNSKISNCVRQFFVVHEKSSNEDMSSFENKR